MNYIKKNLRLWMSAIVALCTTAVVAQTTGATLTVSSIEGAAGKEVSVPVYLTNAEEVVAVQFDVELPYALTSDIVLSENRKDGHTVNRKSIGTNKYRVTVMSFSNKAIKGNSGLLMRLPMTVAEETQADDIYPMTLSNIVVAKADGTNVATAMEQTATFTVQRVPTPDLIVTDVTVDEGYRTLTPGDKLRVSYKVTNQGNAESGNGWTENIYLVDVTGARTFVGSVVYENTLISGTALNRYAEVTIPQVMRIDGEVTVYVELVNNKQTGELIADQGNNSAQSTEKCTLAKKLFLTPDNAKITEGSSKSYTLKRSGDWSMDETYTLSCENEGVLSFPETVTIKAGQSGVSFRVTVIDDNEVSTLAKTYINVAEANGYEAVRVGVLLGDNDDYPLTLTTEKTAITEGDELTLTVKRGGPLDEELKVNITCSQPSRMTTLRAITIPAGKSEATATVSVRENLTPQADVTVTYTAQKTDYKTSKVGVSLTDGDRPNLKLTLSTDVVSEADGYGAVMATVTRDGETTDNLNIFIDNSSEGEVYFDANRYTISAGSSSVTFPIGVTDNSIKEESTREYDITATIYLTDVKQADKETTVSQTLKVTDNDAQHIKLESKVAAINEGSTAKVTVSHNNAESTEAVIVKLSTDDENVKIYNNEETINEVTIPAGSTSATFEVSVPTNTTADDEHTFTIKATSGYGDATLLFMVSDRTLPDYTVNSVKLSTTTLSANREFDITMDIANKGTATLNAGSDIVVYLSDRSRYVERPYWSTRMEAIETLYLPEEIAPGESKEVTFSVLLPADFEYHTIYEYISTWANRRVDISDEVWDELSYNNNETTGIPVDFECPFTVTSITTDKEVYSPGDIITLKGKVENSREGDIVEVFFYNETERIATKAKVQVDATFEVQHTIGANWGGEYKIGACGLTERGDDGKEIYNQFASIKVYNLEVNDGTYLQWLLSEGQTVEGTINVTNLAGVDIHNVALAWDNVPAGCTIEFDNPIATLASGATGSITYKLTAKQHSTGGSYIEGAITATCDEGISKSVNTYYYCQRSYPEIVFEKEKIETTLMSGTTRSYEVQFGNAGLVETGAITIEVPTSSSWLGLSTPPTMTSLKTNETASIVLALTHQEGMIAEGKYESFVRVRTANGGSKVLPIVVTVVSNEKATLTVDAVDIYTKSAEDGNGKHVQGATVKLVNKMTGEIAMTGTTGEDGKWTTSDLTEGVYDLSVLADRHQTYRETIVVGPGEKIVKETFLPYAAVKVTYTVVETEVVDEYETRIEMVFVPDIPQAVVIPEGLSFGLGGDVTTNVKLTNKGKLTAYNPQLLFPQVEGVTFEVLNDYPEVLYPGESYDMKVRFVGPEEKDRQRMATVVMRYEYKVQGETYANNDGHVAKWGSDDYMPIIVGGGGFSTGNKVKDGAPDAVFKFSESDELDYEEGEVTMPTYEPISSYGEKTSQVVLDIRQKFLLTRQAFRGSLKIENQFTTEITDIVFEANVKNMNGVDVTEMFALDYDDRPGGSIKVDEETGAWTLTGEQVGEAGVIYVPSKETAPAVPVTYLFGGTLAYTDVATGDRVEVELMQTAHTVNPSPDLYLTYFIQREFISDDPLTDVVEPWEPAEFALLIQNKGEGKALDLAIETKAPRVLENYNNLPVTFNALYSSIDGVEGNFPFTNTKIGEIASGENVLARWFFYTNVSGYISDYYAEMTHGSLYGEEFNLITLLGARDLKRSVKSVPKATAKAKAARSVDVATRANSDIFLLDEIEDEENLPDCIIDGSGNEITDLEIVSETTTVSDEGNNTYKLTVKDTRAGWVYGKLHDPTNGTMQLASVVRESDGADMGVNNFWQTDRSIAKDRSTIYENLLHFADNIYGVEETYMLTFVEKPAEPVAITAIEGLPEGTTIEAVKQVKVIFSKEINAGTFTADDIVITCNGTQFDLTQATITKEEGSAATYIVDWSNLTPMYGTHQLAIYTTGITDVDGLSGETSVMKSWTQNITGTAKLNIEVTPSEAGTTSGSGEQDFGYVTLKATAKTGYVFYRWTEDGKVLSTAESFNYLLYKPTTIKAEYVPATYALTIDYDENLGSVNGAASGTYEYGTELTLRAVPNSGYTFVGWKIDDVEQESTDATLSLVVDENTSIEALFEETVVILLMGDVNNDDKVTVTDITLTVSYIMNENPLNFVFVKGDMNKDGNISVTDIAHIVSKILSDETTLTTSANAYRRSFAMPQLLLPDVEATLNSEIAIPMSLAKVETGCVALQMDVVVPLGMELAAVRLNSKLNQHSVSYTQLNETTYRVLVYSMSNDQMVLDNAVEFVVRPMAAVANETSTMTVTNICLVDNALNEYHPATTMARIEVDTAIDEVYSDMVVEGGEHLTIVALREQPIIVYGMDGRAVTVVEAKIGVNVVSLEPGVYLVRGKKIVIN